MSMGWLALDRLNIQGHPFYFQEPFDKFHCFLDLLVLANHSDSTFTKKGIQVTVRRGQVARSLVELSDRWHRDRKTVRKIISELKTANELDSEPYPKKNPVTTIITLFRYDYYVKKYEGRDNEKDTEIPTEGDSEKDIYNNAEPCQTISNKSEVSSGTSGKKLPMLRESFSNPDSGNGRSKTPLNAEEKKLAGDILSWAYDPSNNFKSRMTRKKTMEMLEHTIQKYGIGKIELIYDHCLNDRYPWDQGIADREGENVSAYAEFWDEVRGLK